MAIANSDRKAYQVLQVHLAQHDRDQLNSSAVDQRLVNVDRIKTVSRLHQQLLRQLQLQWSEYFY